MRFIIKTITKVEIMIIFDEMLVYSKNKFEAKNTNPE